MLRKLFRRRDPRAALKSVLGDAELPSFPDVVMRALQLLRQDASLSEVAEVLCSDPGISGRLLAQVNSSANALRRPVKDVPQAATLLGRSRIEETLLGVAVAGALPRTPARGFDPAAFWLSSAWRACAARAFAKVLHPASASACYTAGLLQDMAIPLIAHAVPEYAPVLTRARKEGLDLVALEREVFEWDHAEVAGWMGREWGFPESLTVAIAGHHESASDGAAGVAPAVRLVAHLGDAAEQTSAEAVVEAAAGDHGIANEDAERFLQQSLEQAREVAKLFAA